MHSYTLSLHYRLGGTDPRAMPLEEFLAETVTALEAGDPEAYTVRATSTSPSTSTPRSGGRHVSDDR